MSPLFPDGNISVGVHAAAGAMRPGLRLAMTKEWRDTDRLPEGGFIAVANHVSELDPLVVAHVVYNHGTTPHFMAKEQLFKLPIAGAMLSKLEQIPVARGDRHQANASLAIAQEKLDAGGCIIVYPEGTLTRDPELWPMRMKSGAARLALATGAPVVPLSHWGVQAFLPPYAKAPRPFPRKKYVLQVGNPVELADLRDRPLGRRVLTEATERIQEALTQGVAELRGEEPPAQIWDRGLKQRVPRHQAAAGGDFTPGGAV